MCWLVDPSFDRSLVRLAGLICWDGGTQPHPSFHEHHISEPFHNFVLVTINSYALHKQNMTLTVGKSRGE